MAERTADDVRAEVRTWLEENWDPERPLLEWRGILADSGWGCPTWPVEWFGQGLSATLARVVGEEFDRINAVGAATGTGMSLAAPTILEKGSDELKARLLRPLVTGEHKWCQLFSEPGNGSDLAGLSTRAVRDGDEWIVNGQKVWNTGARGASWGMLLARTDWDVPKHRGITYFAIPMQQPGIEVRPLEQMNYHASFNEVFLSDARVEHRNIVGDEGGGWASALATLMHERGLSTNRRPRVPDGPVGRTKREAVEEATAYFKTYEWYPQRAGRPELVRKRAEEQGRTGEPLVRQEIAAVESMRRVQGWTIERAGAARKAGRPPGPEGSLAKLTTSNIARASNRAHTLVVGAAGMLKGPDSPEAGVVAEVLISTPAQSIAGGTDEIQHNIIGERVL
ncbi:MAG: acyl-CoA dehydrogenase family protein, partial [Acidimicrobiia bacterium]|nr:acyl-CoA dehydrogenase family protein [Acidimicrobiia bacterium]